MSAYPGQKEVEPPFRVHPHVTSYTNPDPDSFIGMNDEQQLPAGVVPEFPSNAPLKPMGPQTQTPFPEMSYIRGFRYPQRFDGV